MRGDSSAFISYFDDVKAVIDIRAVQMMPGYATLVMIERYSSLADEHRRDAADKPETVCKMDRSKVVE